MCDLCSRCETAEIQEKLFTQRNTETRGVFPRERAPCILLYSPGMLLYPPRPRLPFARSCAIYEANRFTLFASLDFAKNVDFCDIYLGT